MVNPFKSGKGEGDSVLSDVTNPVHNHSEETDMKKEKEVVNGSITQYSGKHVYSKSSALVFYMSC